MVTLYNRIASLSFRAEGDIRQNSPSVQFGASVTRMW